MRAFRLANCLLSRIKLVETLREFPKRHASYGKTGNKNVQLLQNDLKSNVARFTTFVPTCLAANQAVASCVNTDFWLDKITREWQHTRKLRHLLLNKWNYTLLSITTFCNLQHPDLLQGKFDSSVVKRAKPLFNSFWNNVAKQVARFCGLIYRIFTLNKTDNHEFRDVQGIIWFFI